jgi:hypothetical protein
VFQFPFPPTALPDSAFNAGVATNAMMTRDVVHKLISMTLLRCKALGGKVEEETECFLQNPVSIFEYTKN